MHKINRRNVGASVTLKLIYYCQLNDLIWQNNDLHLTYLKLNIFKKDTLKKIAEIRDWPKFDTNTMMQLKVQICSN